MSLARKTLLHQCRVLLMVGLLSFEQGIVIGWISPELNNLRQGHAGFQINNEQLSWLASIHEIGKLVIAVPAGLLAEKFGRKPMVISVGVAHLTGWLMLVIARQSIPVLFVGRFLSGIGLGIGNALNSVYLGEVLIPEIRGASLALTHGIYYLGMLFEYIIGAYLSYNTVNLCSLAMCLIFFSRTDWIVESPSYLIMKSRNEEAFKNIAWLRGESSNPENVLQEFDTLRKYMEAEVMPNKGKCIDIFKSAVNRKSLFIVCMIATLCQLSGYSAVVSFSTMLFSSSDNELLSADKFTIIFGVFQLMGTSIAFYLSDRLGRRKLFMMLCTTSAIAHTCTGILYFQDSKTNVKIPCFPWLLFACISVYACSFSAGFGPLNSVIRGEMFPYNVKGYGTGIAILCTAMASFTVTVMFNTVRVNLGVYCNFWAFATVCVALGLFVYFCVPETKKKSLAEIHRLLMKS